MPNTKSAKKRVRQIINSTARNRVVKSRVKTAMRRFNEAIENNEAELASQKLTEAIRQIDKAASKGIIHKNNAAHKKTRLTRLYNAYSRSTG